MESIEKKFRVNSNWQEFLDYNPQAMTYDTRIHKNLETTLVLLDYFYVSWH